MCTTTAVSTSAVGGYTINCVVGTLTADNYDFTPFVAGTLTIDEGAPDGDGQ